MMKRNASRFFACAVAGFLAAVPVSAETGLEVSVVTGNNWKTTTWLGIMPLRHAPQLALWLADANGSFVRTLTVSASGAKNTWKAAPSGGRPESLPVWMHASRAVSGKVDAQTSATPDADVSVRASGPDLVAGTEYIVYLEVNSSFDYNAAWPKNAKKGSASFSGVNGQPSVVYEGRFVAGNPAVVTLVPVGTGSIDGSDGNIRVGLEGLTTALELVKSATVTIK
jgi:hypothetical protein